jgi:hypothetical protein
LSCFLLFVNLPADPDCDTYYLTPLSAGTSILGTFTWAPLLQPFTMMMPILTIGSVSAFTLLVLFYLPFPASHPLASTPPVSVTISSPIATESVMPASHFLSLSPCSLLTSHFQLWPSTPLLFPSPHSSSSTPISHKIQRAPPSLLHSGSNLQLAALIFCCHQQGHVCKHPCPQYSCFDDRQYILSNGLTDPLASPSHNMSMVEDK